MKKSFNKSDQDADQYFLLSILPDLKNLGSRRNKRTFKIQCLPFKLLEEDERESVESSTSVASNTSVWSSSSKNL